VLGGTFIRGGQETRLAIMGFKGGAMAGQPQFVLRLTPGETQTAEGLRVSFLGTRFFTGVVARNDPGAVFIWIAAALFIPAVWATFWFARRRLWCQVVGRDVRMAGMADRFVDLDRELAELVAGVARPEEPPSGPSGTPPAVEDPPMVLAGASR
jgi:cytochrome c biogenesis protein ResB